MSDRNYHPECYSVGATDSHRELRKMEIQEARRKARQLKRERREGFANGVSEWFRSILATN